jgi:regulator of protease activity HflC (stomatin/prohibitin superfamily)
MKPNKKATITPSRTAAWVTVLLLMAGAMVTFWLYRQVAYQALLLLGILQLMPAVANLLLYLPMLKKREATQGASKEEQAAPDEGATTARRRDALAKKLKAVSNRCGRWCYDLWATHRTVFVAGLLLIVTAAFAAYYISAYSAPARIGLLTYLTPVALAALFVLYIVLDKWCKHVGAAVAATAKEGEEPDPAEAAAVFDRAVLNSLRGALSVARLAMLCTAAIVMLRLLKLVYWDSAAVVIVTVLFAYELIFLAVSLAVRVIRRELETSPELSIPMPGLGGEDLGILAYLEKNTGITMRSLWSIRLVGRIVPYAAMSIVLLLWGFSGMVKIESNQQGALYRLGVLQTEPLEPGLHMTLPWPFDSVEVYDTNSVKQMTVGYISEENADNIWTESHGAEEYRLLLGDGKELVSINMRVEFVIEDLYAYLTNSAAPESLMQAAAYELITEKTIGTDLATLLTADRVAFVKDFEAELVRRAKEYGTGLGIVNIVLESIHPPVEIADIYQEIINSRIEAQQVVTTAEGAAKVTVIQAENNYGATIKDAEAKKIAEIAAEYAKVAEIEGHNAAYEKYGDAYEYYLRINALRDAYSKGQLVIDGSDSLTQEDIKGILIMLGVLSAK